MYGNMNPAKLKKMKDKTKKKRQKKAGGRGGAGGRAAVGRGRGRGSVGGGGGGGGDDREAPRSESLTGSSTEWEDGFSSDDADKHARHAATRAMARSALG